MDRSRTAERRIRRRTRMMRLVNVPMRLILDLPFPTPLSRQLMLLHLTGRRSGKSYRQPVSYVRHDGDLLTPGGGRWKLNLEPGRSERIRLQGRMITARPDLLDEVDEVEQLLDAIASASPRTPRFIPVPRRDDGRLDRDGLNTAIRHGFRIVRWHLEPAAN